MTWNDFDLLTSLTDNIIFIDNKFHKKPHSVKQFQEEKKIQVI